MAVTSRVIPQERRYSAASVGIHQLYRKGICGGPADPDSRSLRSLLRDDSKRGSLRSLLRDDSKRGSLRSLMQDDNH